VGKNQVEIVGESKVLRWGSSQDERVHLRQGELNTAPNVSKGNREATLKKGKRGNSNATLRKGRKLDDRKRNQD